MLLKKLFFLLKNKFLRFYNTGVEKEKDESKKKYIVLVNIATINSALVTFFMSMLWIFFTPDILIGFSAILDGFILLVPVYLNFRGQTLTAKKFMVLSTNTILLISTCIFSHYGKLENFYYSIIVAFCFIFSYEERKWGYVSVVITLIYYTVEVTPLHNYLPGFNLVKDLQGSTYINNFGSIMMSVLELIPFLYIRQQWEIQLIKHQKILEDNKHQLQVQNEDLETFSIAASHSLQTPIYVAKFLLNKIKKNEEENKITVNNRSFDIIKNSLDQMDLLVSGLFSYNNIIKIEEAFSTFNVTKECMLIKKRMEEKFSTSKIIIPTEDFFINTNQVLFSIIIQNLIENGLKYNTSKKPLINLYFQQRENTVTFFISDNGIGIEEKNFNKIFEPFKRLNPDSRFKGNGLGLAGAKRAAERIGGKLFCKESSSAGSLFQLDIPIKNSIKNKISDTAQKGS